MKATHRVAATVLATGLLLGGATAAQAAPSNGTGITTSTTTYSDGVKLSTVAGFASIAACNGGRSAKVSQLRNSGHTIRWYSECYRYDKTGKIQYQVLYK